MNQLEFKKIIQEETRGLPGPILEEIIDFVMFLKQRKMYKIDPGAGLVHEELKSLDSEELTHLEEEFKNYKERYPRDE